MENKLILFVEVSITVLAFSSIIFQVRKTNDPDFNGYAFMGIMIHGFLALVFTCGALVCMEMVSDFQKLFGFIGLSLGVPTFFQAIAVLKNDRQSHVIMKILMFTLAVTISGLQIIGLLVQPALSGAYFLLAVMYHIFMSLVLFMVMIFQVLDKSEQN